MCPGCIRDATLDDLNRVRGFERSEDVAKME